MFRKSFKKGESCVTSVKHGFSLVELLVVITIIAIMSVVAYTAVGGQTVKAKDAKRKQDIGAIQQALELYFVENSKYPDEASNIYKVNNGNTLNYQILDETKVPKKLLSVVPKDPKTATDLDATPQVTNQKLPYAYKYDSVTKTYQLGATLEDENGVMTAFVTGNSDTDLLSGVKATGAACAAPGDLKPKNGSTTCFPYIFD